MIKKLNNTNNKIILIIIINNNKVILSTVGNISRGALSQHDIECLR